MTTTQTKIPERGTKEFRQYAAEVMASDGPWEFRPLCDAPDGKWWFIQNPCWSWNTDDFRIAVPPPQPVIKPWTRETCPIGAAVRGKITGRLSIIVQCDEQSVYIGQGFGTTYAGLLADFEQLDGSPCGTLEEKREWYTQPSGFKDGTAVIRIDQDDSVHLISKKGYDTVASHTAERVREMYTRITAAEAAELLRGKEAQA